MSTESEMLLSAEQAVQRVLESAASLQERAGQYEDAQRHIADTKKSFVELAGELKACAESLKTSAEGMSAAGTPEIMAKLNGLVDRVSALEEASSRVAGRVDAQISKSIQQLDEGLSNKIRSELSATKQALASEMAESTRSMSEELYQRLGQVDDRAMGIEVAAKRAGGRQKLILVLLLITILGVAASVAIPFLGLAPGAN